VKSTSKPYTMTRSDIGSRQSYEIRVDGRLLGRVMFWSPFGWLASGHEEGFETKEAAAEVVYQTFGVRAVG
jgi:hypothetical protein